VTLRMQDDGTYCPATETALVTGDCCFIGRCFVLQQMKQCPDVRLSILGADVRRQPARITRSSNNHGVRQHDELAMQRFPR
jgi:dTDP-D-glucose 4,6-dehydratase